MAQNGPHGHQGGAASDDGHSAPPTTIAFSLTSAGPYGNGGSSSSAGNMENMDVGGMGKQNLIPDVNMEDCDDSAGGSKDKPHSEAEVEVAAVDVDTYKGKNIAADDGELNVNIILERERRKKMKDLFRALRDHVPHIPQRSDRVTIVGEAIEYIKTLEKKAAKLGMQKQARQAAARGEASSSASSFSLTAMPQTVQGMAALSGVPRAWGGVLQPVPPASPAVPASPIRFRTWSGSNVVLTVANDNAYISVCAPRRPNTLTMVMSVLHNHGMDVVTAQISSDSVRFLFLIFAHLTRPEGANTSSEQVYQRAASEIMLRLNNNN